MTMCTSCGSDSIVTSKVDGRNLYYCPKCKNLEYDKRGSTNGLEHLLDGITSDVKKNGESEIHYEVLLNCMFKLNGPESSYTSQLNDWAKKNYLSYRFSNNGTIVVFRRMS